MKRLLSTSKFYSVSEKVKNAIAKGIPVVALESTIITHGMPYPHNLNTALDVEKIITDNGCVPATIALMDGQVKIGLENHELQRLAETGINAIKTSRRDFSWVISQKKVGATTVSGTMIAAHKAGISVFVTGGIGGCHRFVEETMDISADLTELGRTPVAVVCAGIKSILDIGKTLEYLETMGVTVGTFGPDLEFPAFYTRSSGFKASINFKTTRECAEMIHANQGLQLNSGMVIACPIPKENEVSDPETLEKHIENAIQEAKTRKISGKDITPFLLEKVKSLTAGKSLEANIALVKNNAKIGSRIAVELANIQNKRPVVKDEPQRPLIVGGIVFDTNSKVAKETPKELVLNTSAPGTISEAAGGVGRNVAEACHRVGGNPIFVAHVGNDRVGDFMLKNLEQINFDTSNVLKNNLPTARYSSFLDGKGDLIGAVADMRVHSSEIGSYAKQVIETKRPSIVAIDGNSNTQCIDLIVKTSASLNIPVLFEPTSVVKSSKAFLVQGTRGIKFITPDRHEAQAMTLQLQKYPQLKVREITSFSKFAGFDKEVSALLTLLTCFDNVVMKLGSDGVLLGRVGKYESNTEAQIHKIEKDEYVYVQMLKPRHTEIVSVIGAGDTLVGVLLAGLAKNPNASHQELVRILSASMAGAELSVASELPISEKLDFNIWKTCPRNK